MRHGPLSGRLIRLRPRASTAYVSQGRTVFAMNILDGSVTEGGTGLFVHETRLLSRYRWLVNGRPPQPVGLSQVKEHTWAGYYIAPPSPSGEAPRGRPPEYAVEVRLSRFVGDGLHEDVDLVNYAQQRCLVRLELEVDADFADYDEIEGGERHQHGDRTSGWTQLDGAWELELDYRVEHAFENQGESGVASTERGVRVRIARSDSPPVYDDGRIRFEMELEPLQRWHACVDLIPRIDGETLRPQYGCRSFAGVQNERDVKRGTYFHYATAFSGAGTGTLADVVHAALEQATHDLIALRLYDLDRGERAWTLAAGLPVYVSLFGRDTLTAAWQSSLVSTDVLRGTLPELARWQGRESNDWRDEQPGKMLHQARTGPAAALNVQPYGRYYGSLTTSGFYPVTLSELWHWTGDRELVGSLLEPALRAIRWLDTHGDLDGDGFYEYHSRSTGGLKHHGWKDSNDAIVDVDGRPIEPPIATCEEQGFAYLAKLHMSEVLWWFDRKEEARRLFREASELKKRFCDAFWMEDERFFALGLDAGKRQIKAIASNAGHCLATGIVEQALVADTAARLVSAELFSGWGIRTLSSKNPAYNPYAYHRGTVWPVEHGTFALAFLRYGLREHVNLLCRAQFEAASFFEFCRLPECFSGHARDADHPFPVPYPKACWPQAWSSSAVICFLQAMLGLYPYAPLHLLLVDPELPDWLPEITLRNLHIGEAVVDLRFWRDDRGRSDFEVLEQRGRLHVIRQPSPWSLTASFAERLKDALVSFIK